MILQFIKALRTFTYTLSQIKQPFQNVSEKSLFKLLIWQKIQTVMEKPNQDLMIQITILENLHIFCKFCEEIYLLNNTDTDNILKKQIQRKIIEFMKNVLAKDSIESENIKIQEILLENIDKILLCELFDRKFINEEVPQLIITLFNKTRTIKQKMLQQIPKISKKLDNYNFLISCVQHSLNSSDEILVFEVISCFNNSLQQNSLSDFEKKDCLKIVMPYVLHPSAWIRHEAVSYLKGIIKDQDPLYIYCQIQPIVQDYLENNILVNIDILDMLLPNPIDKSVYEKYNNYDTIKKHELEKETKWNKLFFSKYLNNRKQITNENARKQSLVQVLEIIDKKFNLENEIDELFEDQSFKDMMKALQIDKYQIYDKKKLLSMIRNNLQKQGTHHLQNQNETNCQKVKDFIYIQLRNSKILIKLNQLKLIDEYNLGKFEGNQVEYKFNVNNWKPSFQLITTIYEHTDVVSCLETIKDSNFFLTGSYDGYVKIFDVNSIEQDFSSQSIASMQIENQDSNTQKIKCLNYIESTKSILVGTNKGVIDLFRIDCMSKSETKNKTSKLQRYHVNGEVKKIQSHVSNKENCFLYATNRGHIGLQDVRQKNQSLLFDAGRERGLINTMLIRNNTAIIGTLNGYLLLYDLRCNLIFNLLQMHNSDGTDTPIINISNYKPITFNNDLSQVCITIQSQFHEICVFDLNNNSEHINPNIYLVSNQDEDSSCIYSIPYLKNERKNESFLNFSNFYSLRSNIQWPNPSLSSISQFLTDPLLKTQNSIQEKWMERSLNKYKNIGVLKEELNSAKKTICLPQYSKFVQYNQKINETVILSGGDDKNIRFWTVNQDSSQVKIKTRGGHFSSSDQKERNYYQSKLSDITVVHEVESKNKRINSNQIGHLDDNQSNLAHKDAIEDMIFIEREKAGLLVSAGRDGIVKIWK